MKLYSLLLWPLVQLYCRKSLREFLEFKKMTFWFTLATGNSIKQIFFLSFFHTGTNVCAKNNGGCHQLCLYRGKAQRTCACAHGYLAEDGITCLRHEGYLLYSGRTILKSIHLSDENNLNSPVRPYENPEYFKNVIALAFDYSLKGRGTNRIFFSDAHFGNIQVIKDNWAGRRVLIESK